MHAANVVSYIRCAGCFIAVAGDRMNIVNQSIINIKCFTIDSCSSNGQRDFPTLNGGWQQLRYF